MKKIKYSIHADWLRMLESNTPILNVSVMEQAFPQGPEACSTVVRQDLYQDYQTWRDIRDEYLDILRASSPGDVKRLVKRLARKRELISFMSTGSD